MHSDADRTMSAITGFGLFDGVKVPIDNAVEISDHNPRNLYQFLMIKPPFPNKFRQRDRRQVANRHLILRHILDNFGTKIRTFNRAEMLLI